eukprot:25906_1
MLGLSRSLSMPKHSSSLTTERLSKTPWIALSRRSWRASAIAARSSATSFTRMCRLKMRSSTTTRTTRSGVVPTTSRLSSRICGRNISPRARPQIQPLRSQRRPRPRAQRHNTRAG